jgi:hypothetical protein
MNYLIILRTLHYRGFKYLNIPGLKVLKDSIYSFLIFVNIVYSQCNKAVKSNAPVAPDGGDWTS